MCKVVINTTQLGWDDDITTAVCVCLRLNVYNNNIYSICDARIKCGSICRGHQERRLRSVTDNGRCRLDGTVNGMDWGLAAGTVERHDVH